MNLPTRIKRSAIALFAASGLFSTSAIAAATVAAAEVVSTGVPQVAEEKTFLDEVGRLNKLGIDPIGNVGGSFVRERPLSGIEIANVRIAASKSQLPRLKRWRKYCQPLPHFGDKQTIRMLGKIQKRRTGL